MSLRITEDEVLVGRMREDTDIKDGLGHVRKLRLTYDFAVLGGAISAISLGDLNDVIPDRAVVLGGFVDVLTTLTTAGGDAGTVAVSVEGADDIVAAVAVNDGSNPWDAGLQDIVPDRTAANMVKATSDQRVVVTIAGQVVTAGKFEVTLEYQISLG